MARNLLVDVGMKSPRGIRRRILFSFLLLIAIVGLESGIALRSHQRVHDLLEDVASAEQAIESALRLSAAVRDQYAHQAHTVILNNRSHLEHYSHAIEGVERALSSARAHIPGLELKALNEIERLVDQLDKNFQENILPRIPDQAGALAAPHDTALGLVEQIVQHVDSLTEEIDSRVQRARLQADRAERELWVHAALLLLVGLSLAAGVGIYLDRSLTQPLRELEAGTLRLAAGDLETQVKVERDDEIGSLARHFNQMAGELAIHQERLVQSEKLAGIGRLAAGVAHEINNPLAVIRGYAHLIARGTDEKSMRDAKVIAEEVERCQTIVSGLLELSKAPRLVRESIDLAELVREVAERMSDPDGTPIALRLEGTAIVEADEGKLRQILTNLLRNAQEAADHLPVEIMIRVEGTTALLSVRDRGSGLADEARSRLFEPFFTTKPSGTGLGLALSASLARAHGGELTLAHSGPDGTTFELALPRHLREEAA